MCHKRRVVIWFAGTSRSLFDTVRIRKLSFFGHIMRHDSLQCELIEGLGEFNEEEGNQECSGATTSANGLVSPSWTPSQPSKTGEDKDPWQATSIDTPRGKVRLHHALYDKFVFYGFYDSRRVSTLFGMNIFPPFQCFIVKAGYIISHSFI